MLNPFYRPAGALDKDRARSRESTSSSRLGFPIASDRSGSRASKVEHGFDGRVRPRKRDQVITTVRYASARILISCAEIVAPGERRDAKPCLYAFALDRLLPASVFGQVLKRDPHYGHLFVFRGAVV